MENETVKFEAGKTYYYRFIGDSDLVVKCKVTNRTAKTITFIDLDENKTYTKRIRESEIANTMRDEKIAFAIAYNSSRKDVQRRAIDEAWMRRGAYRQNDGRADALNMLRRLLTENCGNYTKVPMLGHTRLYFCHPGYGHADYNKVRTCAIEGNEEFVNKIVKIGKIFMAKHNI